MARKIKPTIFRFSMKLSNKIFEIGNSADFAHFHVKLKLDLKGCVKIVFDGNG
jgi:hypothetical protein